MTRQEIASYYVTLTIEGMQAAEKAVMAGLNHILTAAKGIESQINNVLNLGKKAGLIAAGLGGAFMATFGRQALENTIESDQLARSWELLSRVVGDGLAPYVRMLSSSLTALAYAFNALDQGTKDTVIQIAVIGTAIGGLTVVASVLAPVIGLAFEAAAIVASLSWATASAAISGSWAVMTTVAGVASTAISFALTAAATVAELVWTAASALFAFSWTSATAIVSGEWAILSGIASAASTVIGLAYSAAASVFGAVWTVATAIASGEFLAMAGSAIASAFSMAAAFVTSAAASVGAWLAAAVAMAPVALLATAIAAAIVALAVVAAAQMAALVGAIISATGAFAWIRDEAVKFWDTLTGGAEGSADTIKTSTTRWVSHIVLTLQSAVAAVGNTFNAMSGLVTDLINKAIDLYNYAKKTAFLMSGGLLGSLNDTEHIKGLELPVEKWNKDIEDLGKRLQGAMPDVAGIFKDLKGAFAAGGNQGLQIKYRVQFEESKGTYDRLAKAFAEGPKVDDANKQQVNLLGKVVYKLQQLIDKVGSGSSKVPVGIVGP